MAQITSETLYGDIQIGDIFPEGIDLGGEVVGIRMEPSPFPGPDGSERNTVNLTVRSHRGLKVHEHNTGALWADETVGAAVERSRFMSALVDHS